MKALFGRGRFGQFRDASFREVLVPPAEPLRISLFSFQFAEGQLPIRDLCAPISSWNFSQPASTPPIHTPGEDPDNYRRPISGADRVAA